MYTPSRVKALEHHDGDGGGCNSDAAVVGGDYEVAMVVMMVTYSPVILYYALGLRWLGLFTCTVAFTVACTVACNDVSSNRVFVFVDCICGCSRRTKRKRPSHCLYTS